MFSVPLGVQWILPLPEPPDLLPVYTCRALSVVAGIFSYSFMLSIISLSSRKKKLKVRCSFSFLSVFSMPDFPWQSAHCRQWAQNHQHWVSSVHTGTFPTGATCHSESHVQKGQSHCLPGWANQSKRGSVFRSVLYVFYFFILLPCCLRKCIDDRFFNPNYLVLLND